MRFAKLTPIVAILALAACDNQPETTAEGPVTQEEGVIVEQQPAAPAPGADPTVTAQPGATGQQDMTAAEPGAGPASGGAPMQTTEVEPIIEGGGEPEVTVITPESGGTQTAATPQAGGQTGDTTGAISATDAPMVEPGSYASDELSLELGEDGTFTLTGAGGDAVEGDWRVFDDTMTLSNTSGATGTVQFPMTCRVSEDGEGFRITADTGSCEMLDGQVFQPQG